MSEYEMVTSELAKVHLNERYKNAVSSGNVVLVMNGRPTFPMCGFSSTVCQMLKQNNIVFRTVDVLADPELSEYFREKNTPEVIPYLYVHGKFIGGYNKIVSLFQSGEFFEVYPSSLR